MRKALIVGIDYYEGVTPLFGCVNDAHAVAAALERHGDGKVNFDVKLLTGKVSSPVSRSDVKDLLVELFSTEGETAFFYFAGHGCVEATGGYLLASDATRGDEGLSLHDVLTTANTSRARNNIIVLDSCHSGIMGTPPARTNAELSEGMTILTASTEDQYASEMNGRGVFTELLVDALNGAASNLVGDVTPGAVYAHIDQSLGAWEQRPVFKTNVKSFVSLRKVNPPIALGDLRRIVEFFPEPGFQFQLDPTYEPELKGRSPGMPAPDPVNTAKFAILQGYNRVNLVVPEAKHMWNAAMESKSCKLTVLGEHYRRLVERGRI